MQVCIIRSQEPVSAAVRVLKRGARRLFKVHHPRSQSDRRVEKKGGEAKCAIEEGQVTPGSGTRILPFHSRCEAPCRRKKMPQMNR